MIRLSLNLRRARLCTVFCALGLLAEAAQFPAPVRPAAEGRLEYLPDAKGNRVPDFSHAGYGGGGVAIPQLQETIRVEAAEGEDGARIQAALDELAQRSPDRHGFRGAVVLGRGEFQVAGNLRIRAGGIVLRGQGSEREGTVLLAVGTDRRNLIEVHGQDDRKARMAALALLEEVPVGGTRLKVQDSRVFQPGDKVWVRRFGRKEWIEKIGMHEAPARSGFSWKPGTVDVVWDRTVVQSNGGVVVLDAPVTTAIETVFGGGTVASYDWPGRVQHVGVENVRCVSAYDRENPKDEEHSWIAIHVQAARDVWIRNVTAQHFVSSAVYLAAGASRVTVENCASVDPVSENAGYRRLAFFSAGEQTLFRRCRSEKGRNDFTVGYLAAGPNVFLECSAIETTGFSGSIGSWASGVLFDNVSIDGGELRLDNLETWNQGVGWAAANSVIWQSKASRIICRTPPTAMNWAVGVWGMFVGDGRWSATSEFAEPESLYLAQLSARLPQGENKSPASSAVSIAVEAERSSATAPMIRDAADAVNGAEPRVSHEPLKLEEGRLIAGGRFVTGKTLGLTWWRGQLNPVRSGETGPALTRFSPGREGLGLTDDLEALANRMVEEHHVSVRHHWGLWYDRRSDDHQMVRRPDPDVWPPFYEQPWRRSGKGQAWDGLSRYDLTQFNPWYFGRIREFARLSRERGRVLVNEMYFQHNILEAGAHWASFPWRPANCLQATGFPEPPPYAGDKRVFMAEAFYDVSHPLRRELHRAYIRQCLSNLAEEPNVIHTTGAEYSGPLHFVQFWLDVVSEWMAETGRKPLIALSAPKDVQDAILADPQRSAAVSIIDLTYWWRNDKGEFAPAGGQNLAPRQHERGWKHGKATGVSLAEMAHEYRTRFPDKALITGLAQPDPWAFAIAGGSLPALPKTADADLLAAFARMKPVRSDHRATWLLSEEGTQHLGYAAAGENLVLDLSKETGRYVVRRIDPRTGVARAEPETVEAGRKVTLPADRKQPLIVWLTR